MFYKNIFVDAFPQMERPILTPVFINRRHYTNAFKIIQKLWNTNFDFQGDMLLFNIQKMSYLYEMYNFYLLLDIIDKDSLVIIITVRAREQLMKALIDKIKEHHPKILLLTMNQTYQNDDIDWIYRIDGTESQYSESSLQGTMNFLSLLNLIYVRYGLLYRE